MLFPIAVLALSLLWILAVSIAARTLLPNRFVSNPRLGLVIWFSAFISSAVAVTLGLAALGAAYFYSVNSLSLSDLDSPDWLARLAISFLPWIALATFGILLVIVNLRVEAPIITGRKLRQDFQLAKREFMTFEGIRVSTIALPINYALATKDEIILSKFTVDAFSKEQLEAVLWHELGHIRGRHNLLKAIAAAVALVTRPITLSKVFQESVDQLCELAADRFAQRHCSTDLVAKVRSVMRDSN